MASHNDRMAEIGFWAAPKPDSAAGKRLRERIEKFGNAPEHKKRVAETFRSAVALVEVQKRNGAGFSADKQLREYNLEYNGRVFHGSLRDMPGSFNVVEAFNKFIPRTATFELRTEHDHLFSFQNFIDWATSEAPDNAADESIKLLEEGQIYSFNSIDRPSNLLFSNKNNTEFGFSSVSLVRFSNEVSIILTAGQKCDLAEESEKIKEAWESVSIPPHRAHIKPADDLVTRAEPLPEDPSLWKTVVLQRLDTSSKTVDARYVFQDWGSSYSGPCDDISAFMFDGEITEERKQQYKKIAEALEEYETLLELCKSCLLLPLFFRVHDDDIEIQRHPTTFRDYRALLKNKKTIERVEARHWVTHRELKRIRYSAVRSPDRATFDAPNYLIERTGYWRKLEMGSEGRDKAGRPIQGRTWVEQTLSWVEDEPRDKTLHASRASSSKVGESAGYIYVMRSAAHPKDVFKVGLTRRTTEQRSRELSQSTASPDHLFVMQEWETSDCILAEREIHAKLDAYRINPKREFFSAPYKTIFLVIDEVISRIDN